MRLHEHTEAGVDILRVEGEVDLHFAPVLRQVLNGKAQQRCPALLLDLSAVEFINSSGIAAILEYLRDAAENRALFCIGGISPRLRPIVEMVRLDRSMPVFADAARAKEAIIARRLPAVSQPLFADEVSSSAAPTL
jgi:anti-sigma B factor antagonist